MSCNSRTKILDDGENAMVMEVIDIENTTDRVLKVAVHEMGIDKLIKLFSIVRHHKGNVLVKGLENVTIETSFLEDVTNV